ncbi:MAG: hypothetical protein WD749_03290 [Phycisphaerales bacterium]
MFRKLAARLISWEAAPARTALAAFGKHPGWNDHIDDLGLETDALVNVKRFLYVEGIGGNIDSGAWERLADEQRLPGFDHAFVVRGGSDLVVGRLWSSSDGKGRTKYPMVVCADCSGMGVGWALAEALPVIDGVRRDCQATPSPGAVRDSLDRARAGLLARAAAAAGSGELGEDGVLPLLAARAELGPDGLGLLRILYQIERELPIYRRGAPRNRSVVLQPQHLRVPACAPSLRDRLELWLRFLEGQLEASAPVVLLAPEGQDWVDILVGSPAPTQFFCIRAGPKAVPLTTEIPYTLDPDFVARARRLIGP